MNYLALLGWSFDGTHRDLLQGRPAREVHAWSGSAPRRRPSTTTSCSGSTSTTSTTSSTLDDLTARVDALPGRGRAGRPAADRPEHPEFARVRDGGRAAQGPAANPGRGAGPDGLLPARRPRPLRPGAAGPEEDRAGRRRSTRSSAVERRSGRASIVADEAATEARLARPGRGARPEGRAALHADPRRRHRPHRVARPLRDAARDRQRAGARRASPPPIAALRAATPRGRRPPIETSIAPAI